MSADLGRCRWIFGHGTPATIVSEQPGALARFFACSVPQGQGPQLTCGSPQLAASCGIDEAERQAARQAARKAAAKLNTRSNNKAARNAERRRSKRSHNATKRY